MTITIVQKDDVSCLLEPNKKEQVDIMHASIVQPAIFIPKSQHQHTYCLTFNTAENIHQNKTECLKYEASEEPNKTNTINVKTYKYPTYTNHPSCRIYTQTITSTHLRLKPNISKI